jgi:hypothetical protein
MERTWSGRVRAGSEGEHQQFTRWLGSGEGLGLLARSQLDGYQLLELAGRVTVRLSAHEPPAIIHFLRNRRFWPDYWEFESADPAQAVGPDAAERVRWSREPR